jgi:hypothetical protein
MLYAPKSLIWTAIFSYIFHDSANIWRRCGEQVNTPSSLLIRPCFSCWLQNYEANRKFCVCIFAPYFCCGTGLWDICQLFLYPTHSGSSLIYSPSRNMLSLDADPSRVWCRDCVLCLRQLPSPLPWRLTMQQNEPRSLRLDERGSTHDRGRYFFSLCHHALYLTRFPIQCVPVVKWLERAADHSPPLIAEV